MFIVSLVKKRGREKKEIVCLYVLSSDRPMKKCSAQPTGNGKRIIIIITTLLPLECLQAGKKKEKLCAFPFSILRSYYAKKRRKTDIYTNVVFSFVSFFW
jgi:hypothetical protein